MYYCRTYLEGNIAIAVVSKLPDKQLKLNFLKRKAFFLVLLLQLSISFPFELISKITNGKK